MGTLLFIYSVVVYALANMLVYFNGPFGVIDKIRRKISSIHPTLEELFNCMFCLPTNIGIILSIIALCTNIPFTPYMGLFSSYSIWVKLFGVCLDGLYAGGITYLIHTMQNYFEAKWTGNYLEN